MSSMDLRKKTSIQAKIFDFALLQLVFRERNSFQPLWTVDSWVKFLIWLSLNCGLSGEKKSLEFFAEALGAPLSRRMRKLFFERVMEEIDLRVIADPAEEYVCVMHLNGSGLVTSEITKKAFIEIGLMEKVVSDQNLWRNLDAMMLVPWKVAQKSC